MNAEEGQIEGGARGRSGTRGGRGGCGWDIKERKTERRTEGRERDSGSVQVFAEPPRAW